LPLPLDLYTEREKNSEDRRMLMPRFKATTAEVPALRAHVAELRATASTNMVALEGATDASASANLQSRIEEHASATSAIWKNGPARRPQILHRRTVTCCLPAQDVERAARTVVLAARRYAE